MFYFLTRLFDTTGWPPRWYCGQWTSAHGWLHILSDLGVWSAYIAIPLVLWYFVLRRRDIPFRTVFILFGAFILACGTTHLMEAIIFWWPAYRLAGVIKLFTAIVSWSTVIALIPTAPKVLALRTPAELEKEVELRTAELAAANQALRAEVKRREQVEDELREQREWFRTTLGSIADAVIVTDPNGAITYMNPTAAALTGWPASEALGRPLDDVYRTSGGREEDAPKSSAGRAMASGKAQRPGIDTALVARNGGSRPIEDTAAPLRSQNGDVLGVVLVFRDVTARRKAEDELRVRAKQLAEADRRKDEFLAMLAHELRNPLAPVRNAVQIMQMTDADNPNVRWAREVIGRQVGHMARLVDDLLDVSRITRGMIALRPEVVDLSVAIDRAVETARPLLDARRHDLTVNMPAGPIWVKGDLTRLAQVFANLLNNAAKYTPDGGRVTVTAELAGGDVAVRVRDSGVGIAPDLLPQVFDLFTQADRSLDRSQGGLGIGLSLVKTLVELHGGTAEARSDGPGSGSEFAVRLPLARPESSVAGVCDPGTGLTEAGYRNPHPSRRVLVVDDNADAAETLAVLLRASGHVAETAPDGPTALAAVERFRPDAVLLDIGLPGMDGYEVARRLRSIFGDRLVLVAITGYGGDDVKRHAAEAGFDRHLVKPVSLDEVQAVLRPAAV